MGGLNTTPTFNVISALLSIFLEITTHVDNNILCLQASISVTCVYSNINVSQRYLPVFICYICNAMQSFR